MIIAKLSNKQEFYEFMSKKQEVVIITHSRPDADALGSSLAMHHILEKQGHNVTVVVPNEYPEYLNWMKGNKEIIVFENSEKENIKKMFEKATIIFHLDYSSLNRISKVADILESISPKKNLLVDHHIGPTIEADYMLWNSDAAATCELMYMMVKDLNWTKYIDKNIAECLYAGILTDTGCFRHQMVSANVHSIVSELIQYGADAHTVGDAVYNSYEENRLKLLGYMLLERLVILPELKTAYFYLTNEDQQNFNVKTGDTEGIVNYGLSIKGILISALFTENKNNTVKISFRSKGNVPVNELSKEYFSGGGHKNASGGLSELPLEQTLEKFKQCISENKNKYLNA